MCTPGIEATSLIARMLVIEYGLKCTSIGKNLKGTICVKVFEPQFVYIFKVSSEVQSKKFPIIYLLLNTLEVNRYTGLSMNLEPFHQCSDKKNTDM